MNISPLLRTVCQTINSVAPKILSVKPLTSIINCTMHQMCNRQYLCAMSTVDINKISSVGMLQPSVPTYNLTCGLKTKTVLHRRCKSCKLIWKNERRYIICKAHPRHKQVERKKQPYNTWILTFASQKPVRDW